MYHLRIVHLCNVKEVFPSKRLNSRALVYLFYLFVSWFHNNNPTTIAGKSNDLALAEAMKEKYKLEKRKRG